MKSHNYTDEQFFMLEAVNLAVSDYLLALENEGFAKEYGGVERFLNVLKCVHAEYEKVFNEDQE